MASGLKTSIKNVARKAGYDVVRVDDVQRIPGAETFVPELAAGCASIPGMIGIDQGLALYWMAYASAIDGDIVEIGSWQGRSTAFLAAACRDSGNGRVHAIDHFKGNPGKALSYVVGRDDLSDLRPNFEANMSRLGVSKQVVLHCGASEDLADEVRAACGGRARLLFIDGEHTHAAVTRDLANYAPLLAPGGVLVFDDYTRKFPEVVAAVQEFLASRPDFSSPVQNAHTLVVRRTT